MAALSLVSVLLWADGAVAQRPVAVAEERADLDGDGRIDVVRVGQGRVSVMLNGKDGALWKPFQTAGKMVDGRLSWGRGKSFGGGTVIVAEAEIRAGRGAKSAREAIALELSRGKLRELWRGEVGPVGVDGESSLHVEAHPKGLLRYHGRPGVVRCDGKTPHLYNERYDFRQNRFRPASDLVRVDKDAPRLTATRTPPEGVAPDVEPIAFRASAASSMLSAQKPRDLVPPREIDDGDETTAWVEGKGGFGAGEFVTVKSDLDEQEVRYLRLVPGHAAGARTFTQYNRLKRAGLLVGDRAFWIELPADPLSQHGDVSDPYFVELPEPVSAECVTLIIDEVYFGRLSRGKWGRSAVSELAVIGSLELSPAGAFAVLAERVASGQGNWRRSARVLGGRGPAAAKALIHEARRHGQQAEALVRLRRTLARIPAGPGELALGLADDDLRRGDLEAFHRALVDLGGQSVAPLAAVLRDDQVGGEGRARAARALGEISAASAKDALLDAAGVGPRALRKEVAAALGGRLAGELPDVIGAARDAGGDPEGREADLWRAAGLLARGKNASPADRRVAAEAMAARLREADGYELRYRLLGAAGALPEPAALAAVKEALRASREGKASEAAHREIALRRVAVEALARSGAAEAAGPLLSSVQDPDPGVRIAAAIALGELEADNPRADAPLAARLKEDRWPEVREEAAEALASRCARPAPARALFAAAAADANTPVRQAALSALVTCRADGIGDRLLEVAADRGQKSDLRGHAIRLLGILGDRGRAGEVVELFATLRREAISRRPAVRLAAQAAWVLGELKDPRAVEPLLEAARDPAFPTLRAAALRGLSRFCPAKAAPLYRELTRSDDRQVALAAREGRATCAAR